MARRTITTVALTGAAAALVLAAAGPTALAAPHSSAKHHHAKNSTKRVTVRGLVANHHGRHVTVFAKTAKVGKHTAHNKRVHLTFAHAVHHSKKVHVGDHISVRGLAHAHGHKFTIFRHSDETVTPAPASLFFGTVVSVSGEQFILNEHTRDNGDREDGDDHGHGGDGDGRDSVRGTSHGGHGSSSHLITVDDADATITVDGSTDTELAAGDTVAVLGEATEDTVVAADVFGYTVAPSFLRGDITAIDGQVVTVGDNQGDDQGDDHVARPAHDGENDDTPVTVDLTEVPLALNGALNASVSDLAVGDKLIVLGDLNSESGSFDADVAFAFNGHDHHPCPEGDDD